MPTHLKLGTTRKPSFIPTTSLLQIKYALSHDTVFLIPHISGLAPFLCETRTTLNVFYAGDLMEYVQSKLTADINKDCCIYRLFVD